jgi:hypothetical protein
MVDDKQQQFIEKSVTVHGDRFDYQSSNYKNIDTKVEIRCIKHNAIFHQSPYNHMKGRDGCLDCINESKSKRLSWTLDEFLSAAKRVHGNRYDYSKVEYKGQGQPVCVVCFEHGDFYVSPSNHIHNKHNCYKCSLIARGSKRRKSHSQFIVDAIAAHGELYDYSKTVYQTNQTKITVTCNNHGDFECSPRDHLGARSGCPRCKSSKGEMQVRQVLVENHIAFLEQHRFNDCRGKLPLPFDFYLPELNTCIEYDGEGHYRPIQRNSVVDLEVFAKSKSYDDIKTNYCAKNGIRLIRIPFWQLKEIESVVKHLLGI